MFLQLGSRKFAAFTFTSFCISTLVQVGTVVTASSMGINLKSSSGPYFFIYSLLTLYHSKSLHSTHPSIMLCLHATEHVPKLRSGLTYLPGGLSFSDKIWTYLFALQLLLGEGPSSVCAGVSGAVAGWMYLNNAAGLQDIRMPRMVEVTCMERLHSMYIYTII